MDYQTIVKNNIRLNKNKRIGSVIFVVEGNKTEVNLLKKIFSDILDYNFVSENREGRRLKFKSKTDKYSMIYVFNSANSNIKSLNSNSLEDELSEEIRELYDENFSINNSAVFFIFDRDYKSNQKEVVEELIEKYHCSRENDGFDMPGLLLLSYPAVEAYICELLYDKYYKKSFDLGVTLKKFLQNRKIKIEDIREKHILGACKSMAKSFVRMGIDDFDIDHFSEVNKQLLDIQEEYLKSTDGYKLISTISMALIDLGIIEVIDAKK